MKKQLQLIVYTSLCVFSGYAQVIPNLPVPDIEHPSDPLPTSTYYYKDLDSDSFGDASTQVLSPNGMLPSLDSYWVQNGLDCDDTDANVFPGQGCDDLHLSNENYIHEITYTSTGTEEEISHLEVDSEVSSGVISATKSVILKPGFRSTGNVIIKIDPDSKISQPATTRETVTYFNGLGKPIQEIAVQMSPAGKDIIQHIEYDAFGRTAQKYLPFASNQTTGALLPDAKTATLSYYQSTYNDAKPYTETIFEASPMHQITEEVGIGQDFTQSNGRTHKTIIETNNQTDKRVKKFDIQKLNGYYQLQSSFSHYENGTLLVQTTKDQNWLPEHGNRGTSESYKDKNGRLVLERVYDDSENELNTYYIYDPLGNLTFVIPPIAENRIISIGEGGNDNPEDTRETISGTALFPYQGAVIGNLSIEIQDVGLNSYDYSIDFAIHYLQNNLRPGKLMDLPHGDYLPNRELFRIRTEQQKEWGETEGCFIVEIYNGALIIEQDLSQICSDFPTDEDCLFYYASVFPDLFYVEGIETSESVLFTINNTVNQQAINNLCYQYRYDDWNRLIEKKLPGKQWEYIVYDSHDRPILSQDGSLRADNLWAFSKYDVYGRDIYSGLYTNSSDRATLQTTVDNFTNSQNPNNSEERSTVTRGVGQVALNYNNTAFPTTGITEVLAVNYYDNYNFTDTDKPAIPDAVEGQTVTQRTNGLHTASWVKTLGRTSWSKNYFVYDEKAREIKIIAKNHLGGSTEIASELDFRGNLLKATTTHTKEADATPIVIIDEFSYDPQERLLQHQQQINDLPVESIAHYEYDALGTQIQKKVGGQTTALQTIDYSYTIQGALKEINSVQNALSNTADNDLFAYKLNYHNAVEGTASAAALYNGGISQSIWRAAIADEKQSYAYRFDKLNRLIAAEYRSGSTLANDTEKFKLEGLTYDAAGNIKTLQRTGTEGSIDNLNFDHSDSDGNETNQLYDITDTSGNTEGYTDTHPSGDNYSYDNEGRLIADQNKGITSIQYNYLDLPDHITFSDGNNIAIVYDATGNKLEKIYTTNNGSTSTLYLSGFQYQDDRLLFFAQPEGYVTSSGDEMDYVYIYSDHLGNNRLSYSDTNGDDFISIDEIQSSSNYYPMGMLHAGELVTDSYYNYKFQGKELQTENGIYQYDFGSRMYDPAIGRWFVIDPQAESFYGYSPYMAMGNNPIMMVDPDGEFVITSLLVSAIIGSAISGATTVATNLIMGNDWDQGLGQALAIGAVGGAIGGGIGAAFKGTAFGQSSAFSIVNNVASNTATSLAFGQDITFGSVLGSVGGGFLAGQLPQFNGVKGNSLSNGFMELGHRSLTGAVTGAFGGGLGAAVDGEDIGRGFINGARNGAIGGGVQAGLTIAALGTAYVPDDLDKYDTDLGRYKPVFRRGTFITQTVFYGKAAAIGRNLITNQSEAISNLDYNSYLRSHEYKHFLQQRKHGFGEFYGRILIEAINGSPYNTFGTLEYRADDYSLRKLGYYYGDLLTKKTSR